MISDTRRVRLYSLAEFDLPIAWERALLLLVAMNAFFLSFEVFLSHASNQFRVPTEWIPIPWGPLGLITSTWLALRRRAGNAAYVIHVLVMALGILIGAIGFAFHAFAAVGQGWDWLINSAPLLAPLAFCGVGLVGITAAVREDPPESGRFAIPGIGLAQAPVTRHQQLIWLIGLGLLLTTFSVVFDHAQEGGYVFGEWIAIVYGFFASVVTIGIALRRPSHVSRGEASLFVWTMLLGLLVGVAGLGFHVARDLGPGGAIVLERFIDYAPVMAPLLFADLGMLGLIVAAQPVEVPSERAIA